MNELPGLQRTHVPCCICGNLIPQSGARKFVAYQQYSEELKRPGKYPAPLCEDCVLNRNPALWLAVLDYSLAPEEYTPPPRARTPSPTNAAEADPTGRKPNDPGAKLDQGKVRMGLVLGGFANALREVCIIGTKGAAKYSDNGWKEVPNGQDRYLDALYRHLNKHQTGEVVDPEWMMLHLAHAAWNALAILEIELKKRKDQDGLSLPGATGTVAGEAPRGN